MSVPRRLQPRHLRRTFGYPCGVRYAHFSRFDVRDEVCEAVGGFKHGQLVVKRLHGGSQLKALTIGVKPNDGEQQLWFHVLEAGVKGAGLFDQSDGSDLRPFSGRQRVKEARREDFATGSDDEGDNEELLQLANSLELTFRYPLGILMGEPSFFDVRDEVCVAVGGFKHGQVLKLGDQDMVVVGVRLDEEDGLPQLFFHREGHAGSGTIPRRQLGALRPALRICGTRKLEALSEEPHAEGEAAEREHTLRELGTRLKLTFGYPLGTGPLARHALFDVTEKTCLEVGGFRHGQVVREPGGRRAVAVGVRAEGELPELFFHCDGNTGAGRYPNYDSFRKRLVAKGSRKLRSYSPDDPIFRSGVCSMGGLARLLGRLGAGHEPEAKGETEQQEGEDSGPSGHLDELLRMLRSGSGGDGGEPLPEDFMFDFTFWFPVGRVAFDGYERFDVRPEVCKRVGGFEHGQVVRSPDGDENIVVGVLPDPRSGQPRLWFHDDTAFGAFQFGHYELVRPLLRVVGTRKLEPRGPRPQRLPEGFVESLQPTFRYPYGLEGSGTAHFDIRDDVCLAVGGFAHGQVVRTRSGQEMLVVGVRANNADKPQLWFRPRDCRGAGVLPFLSEDPELAGRTLEAVGTEVLVES